MAEILELLGKMPPDTYFDAFKGNRILLACFKDIHTSLVIRSPILDVSL
jgi:hypothetical protein